MLKSPRCSQSSCSVCAKWHWRVIRGPSRQQRCKTWAVISHERQHRECIYISKRTVFFAVKHWRYEAVSVFSNAKNCSHFIHGCNGYVCFFFPCYFFILGTILPSCLDSLKSEFALCFSKHVRAFEKKRNVLGALYNLDMKKVHLLFRILLSIPQYCFFLLFEYLVEGLQSRRVPPSSGLKVWVTPQIGFQISERKEYIWLKKKKKSQVS